MCSCVAERPFQKVGSFGNAVEGEAPCGFVLGAGLLTSPFPDHGLPALSAVLTSGDLRQARPIQFARNRARRWSPDVS
jgi:hypothetical protein